MSLIEKETGIDLLSLSGKLVLKNEDGKTRVFDPVRKKYILLQPEEFVRQLLIQWITESGGINRNSIQVEKHIRINDLSRRFDLVIYDRSIQPFILVECKAADARIGQSTFDQIAVYNMALKAPYLVVTNGRSTYCVQVDHETKSYNFLSHIPVPK